MKAVCPKCRTPIEAEQINVAKDLAHCLKCNEIFELSTLWEDEQNAALLSPGEQPRGTWFNPSFDGFTLGATTRSAAAFFFVPFTCFWSGMSMGGIYGTQIYNGKFEIGQSLFGLPFLIGTCVLVPLCLTLVFGRTTITVRGNEGTTFVGFGPFGIRRRFDWSAVTGVSLAYWGRTNGKPSHRIELEGSTPRRLGAFVTEKRKAYLLAMLRKLLNERRYRPAGVGLR